MRHIEIFELSFDRRVDVWDEVILGDFPDILVSPKSEGGQEDRPRHAGVSQSAETGGISFLVRRDTVDRCCGCTGSFYRALDRLRVGEVSRNAAEILDVVEFGIDGLCGVTHGKVNFRAAFVSFKSDGSADIACCAKYDDIGVHLSHAVV